MFSIGRRKAKYESCPRLLLEQAVALRHKARYAEFLRLFEPSPRPPSQKSKQITAHVLTSTLAQASYRSQPQCVSPRLTCATPTPFQESSVLAIQ